MAGDETPELVERRPRLYGVAEVPRCRREMAPGVTVVGSRRDRFARRLYCFAMTTRVNQSERDHSVRIVDEISASVQPHNLQSGRDCFCRLPLEHLYGGELVVCLCIVCVCLQL